MLKYVLNQSRLLRSFGVLLFLVGVVATSNGAEPVSFRAEIAPILINNCLACHGPKKAEGGYRVDSYERLLSEGDSGSAGVTGKDVEASELFRRIVSEDKEERMPLESDPLTAEDIELVKRWIVEGTFAWISRHRRHSKDYERTTESSEAMIYIAMIGLMLRRLKPTVR